MLDYIRKRSGGFISAIIIGAIALVFVFWGIGGQNTGDGVSIRVDGTQVPVAVYLRFQRMAQENIRQRFPDMESGPLEQAASQSAVSTLIQRHVLGRLADRAGISVPAEAVVASITANTNFRDENGNFSKTYYENVVTNYFRESVASFEAALAEDMRLEAAIRYVQDMNFVPRAALLEDYHSGEDELALAWAFFPYTAYAQGLTPSEKDVSDYWAANRERWRRPARVRVAYVSFDPADYREGLEATEDELADLYQEELATLTTPASAQVSHILFRFPSFTPTAEQRQETRAKADAGMARAATEDFAALAREISEDPGTASQGGELPPLRPGDMVQEFEQAVFDSTPEQREGLIGPVETMFGYHIIKVREFTPAAAKTLEEATPQLTETVVSRKARIAAGQALESLLERAQAQGRDGADLCALAEPAGLACQTSEFFGEADAPAFLGSSAAEAAKAVAQPVGLVSDPVDTATVMSLYIPLEREESFVPELSDPDTREAATAAWTQDEALKLALADAEGVIAGRGTRTLDAAAKADAREGVTTGTSGFFRRLRFESDTQAPVSTADREALLKALFSLHAVGETAPEPIPAGAQDARGYLVLALNGFRTAPEPVFSQTEKSRREGAVQDISEAAYTYWTYTRTAAASVSLPAEIRRQMSGSDEPAQ
ncbi:MAG: SurA N-terminal domain-containing protein [Deltaproteobacteria bacterium]|jgi:peptidyl-prolyl cis-trans isomerase D|nr:SurA N-terminal domain-containing protein [Deltaproteobacteria bacterium]